MRTLLIIVALCAATSTAARGQECRADFNSNGSVEISELITALNEALNGCGSVATPTRRQPTPTRTATPVPDACPFRFNQAVSEVFCYYEGTAESACAFFGTFGSGWVTEGQNVFGVLTDGVETFTVVGRRTSPTSATVSAVILDDEEFPATGTMALPDARTFRVRFNGGGNCAPFEHTGNYQEVIGEVADTRQGVRAMFDAGEAATPHHRRALRRVLEKLLGRR